MNIDNNKNITFIIILAVGLILGIIVALRIGSVNFTFPQLIDIIFSNNESVSANIIKNVRIPRIIVSAFVGANLAISGALLQAVMQNPLADPGLTGVSSGASFGAVIIIILFPHLSFILPLVAFAGGAFACTITYLLAWKNGIRPLRIILSGVAVNSIFGSLTGIINIFYSDRIQNAVVWMSGSTSGKSWTDVKILILYSIIGIVISFFCIRYANLLQLGDKMAKNLGMNTNLFRILLSLAAVFLAAVSVAITGPIGFVGLVVPHIGRFIIGSDYKYLVPFSILMGSFLLVVADTFARTILSPIELPVGLVMALFGAPFFLYLLRKGEKVRA